MMKGQECPSSLPYGFSTFTRRKPLGSAFGPVVERVSERTHAGHSPALLLKNRLAAAFPFSLTFLHRMLSWNEIRHRAIGFSRDNRDKTSEESDKQSFWNDFFHIFGIKRSAVASFEEPVKKLSGNLGKIDLFWPGKLLVEHKSAGQDLDKAASQGMAYIRGLIDSGRHNEVPRWLIVSDFKRIALHDLEPEQDPDLPLFKRQPPSIVFPLEDLHKHIRRFAAYRLALIYTSRFTALTKT